MERNKLITDEHAELELIDHAKYEAEFRNRVDPRIIQPGAIYEARGISPKLERDKSAVRFDVMVERVSRNLEHPIGAYGIHLVILHHLDYLPVPKTERTAIMNDDQLWTIHDRPISLRRYGFRRLVDHLQHGYLLEHPDKTLDTMTRTTQLSHVPRMAPYDVIKKPHLPPKASATGSGEEE